MTIRPFTKELRAAGFTLKHRDVDLLSTVTVFTKRVGDRELHVQLWSDGGHRVSHGTHTKRGLHCTSRPTDFTTVEEMRAAITYEWVRPSSMPPIVS